MARVLLAWELGAGLGHVMPLAEMGRELERAGHAVSYVLRDLGYAHALGLDGARLYQSPLLLPERRRGEVAWTFADILANIGYGDAAALTGLLAAWRQLYADLSPDLIVFDHAPTALAAARGLNIPSILLARSGFTIPPAVSPLPPLRSDDDGNATQREHNVTRSLNAALNALGAPALNHLGELFDADARVLLSVPELDTYGPRDDVEHWGPLEHGRGDAPSWPDHEGTKIFAYLRNFPTRDAMLASLGSCGAPVLAHVNGMTAAECARHSNATLRISPSIIDVRAALTECDLVVTHGGSLVASALVAGKPLLMLPLHLEQQITAARVEALGAGLAAPKLAPNGMHAKLHRLLAEPAFGAAARAFAARYPHYPARLDGRFAKLASRLLSLPV